MERRNYTKVVMSLLFSDENSFQIAQISPTKTQRLHAHTLLRMCFHSLKIVPAEERKVIFPSVSGVILAAVSIHWRPSLTELSSVISWTPLWRISQHYKPHTNTDVCLFMQQSAESGNYLWWIFIKKSYLKWNLSLAAYGKHCLVSETAKPCKAFPPKGST